jgi:endonuclease YncB( thermonuclease family)
MFGRRKNNDGFEWHAYVRTAVRHRREQRRQRMREARHAAVANAGAAGAALAVGSKAAGAAAWDGAKAGAGAAALGLQGLYHLLKALLVTLARAAAAASTVIGEAAVAASRPVIRALATLPVGGPVALASAAALGLGFGRYRSTGLDGEAAVTLAAGGLLLIASLPLLSGLTGVRLPRLGIAPGTAVMAVAVGLVAIGLAWFASSSRGSLATISARLPAIGADKPLEGRARAVGGDRLRVGSTTVRLAGIEAPEPQQRCGANRRCGTAAETALGRIVNGRTVTCRLSGTDSAGRPLATCRSGDTDIGAELVRAGYAFAEGGLFASYSSLEREARNARAGIWAGGEPERPADYRARTAGRRSS